MTKNAFLFKWFWYAMAALPIWLLEDLVFSRFSIFGIAPLLLPLPMVTTAVLEGPVAGTGYSLAIGLWWAAALPGTHSLIIIASALIGLISGLISQYRLSQSYVGCLFCSAVSLLLLAATRIAYHFFTDTAPLAVLLKIALPELLISLVFVAPVYLLFRLVYDRVGGTKLM